MFSPKVSHVSSLWSVQAQSGWQKDGSSFLFVCSKTFYCLHTFQPRCHFQKLYLSHIPFLVWIRLKYKNPSATHIAYSHWGLETHFLIKTLFGTHSSLCPVFIMKHFSLLPKTHMSGAFQDVPCCSHGASFCTLSAPCHMSRLFILFPFLVFMEAASFTQPKLLSFPSLSWGFLRWESRLETRQNTSMLGAMRWGEAVAFWKLLTCVCGVCPMTPEFLLHVVCCNEDTTWLCLMTTHVVAIEVLQYNY